MSRGPWKRRTEPLTDVNLVSAKVRAALALHRFRFQSEMDLHEGISRALDKARLHYEREYRLGGTRCVSVGDGRGLIFAECDEREPLDAAPVGRLDFFVEECLALEVKIGGSWADLYRQLARYSEHRDVKGLLAVTSRLHLSGALEAAGLHPGLLTGKPLNVYAIPPEL